MTLIDSHATLLCVEICKKAAKQLNSLKRQQSLWGIKKERQLRILVYNVISKLPINKDVM